MDGEVAVRFIDYGYATRVAPKDMYDWTKEEEGILARTPALSVLARFANGAQVKSRAVEEGRCCCFRCVQFYRFYIADLKNVFCPVDETADAPRVKFETRTMQTDGTGWLYSITLFEPEVRGGESAALLEPIIVVLGR